MTSPSITATALTRGETVPAGMGLVMLALLLSQFVGNMNATIVTTALPTISEALGGTAAHYSWVMVATVLGMAASTPVWSRLADIRSPKRLMQAGLAIFVVGALGAGLAQSIEMLIAFRAITGVGLGGMVSLGQIIIALLVAPRLRGRYTAWFSAVQLIATLGGPVIGGLIVDTSWLGWRFSFLAGVPVAAVAAIVLHLALKVQPGGRGGRIDYLGAALVTIATVVLLGWTSLAQGSIDPASWESFALLGLGFVILAVAFVVERRHPAPLLPLGTLARRVPLLTLIASVAVGSAMFGGSIFVTQYLQYGRGLTPTQSGLVLVAVAVGSVASSFFVGWLTGRTGRLKAVLVTGMVLLTVATAMLALLGPETPLAVLVIALVIDGLGMGATMQFLLLAAQNEVGPNEVGALSGAVMYVRSLGGGLGLAALGGFLAARVAEQTASGAARAEAYVVAVPGVFAISLVPTVIALVAVIALPRIHLRRTIAFPPPHDQDAAA